MKDYFLSPDKKELIRVLPSKGGKEFVFPDSVERIAKDAFDGNKVIEKLVIPSKIIGPYWFTNMKALKYVYFPDNVISIPERCFAGCENLKEVHGSIN